MDENKIILFIVQVHNTFLFNFMRTNIYDHCYCYDFIIFFPSHFATSYNS